MSDDIEWERLADYLSGRATLTERAELERWARETPERARALAAARALWDSVGEIPEPEVEVDAADVRRAWEALAARVAGAEAPAAAASAAQRRMPARGGPFAARARPRRVMRAVLRAAAVVLVALGGAIVVRDIARQPAAPVAPPAVREIATGRGQRAEIRLADGSRVVLGVASRLRWPATFGTRQRDVELEGEALFVVAHDPARPFVVRSGNAVVRDIGTEFGVHAYADEQPVRVAVRSGAVMIAPARDTSTYHATLRAGDLATLAADGALRVQHGADIASELAFADGRLELVDTPMREVARRLERWYDVRVLVADSLADAQVSASFERDAELSTVLHQLGASLGARVTRHDHTVQFDVRR
jgi:transmembrane sensor